MCGLQYIVICGVEWPRLLVFCVCLVSMLFFGYFLNCIILVMLISPGFGPLFLGRGFDSPLLRKIFSTSIFPGTENCQRKDMCSNAYGVEWN
jgi:hypothetical protein